MQRLVVTGSRLRASISGAPIIVMTREDMQLRGISTIEDAIRSLPQNLATLNATAGSGRQGQGLGNDLGQLSINLRGLGDGNTLVLVNGRRRVQSAALDNGAVNLNGIPFSAIERIEVIPDGASAIYGSDAQAGVINFILRDDYAGSETSLRQEISAHEGDSRTIEQTLGYTWNGGGITGALSYREGESVDSRKAGSHDRRLPVTRRQRSPQPVQPAGAGFCRPFSTTVGEVAGRSRRAMTGHRALLTSCLPTTLSRTITSL